MYSNTVEAGLSRNCSILPRTAIQNESRRLRDLIAIRSCRSLVQLSLDSDDLRKSAPALGLCRTVHIALLAGGATSCKFLDARHSVADESRLIALLFTVYESLTFLHVSVAQSGIEVAQSLLGGEGTGRVGDEVIDPGGEGEVGMDDALVRSASGDSTSDGRERKNEAGAVDHLNYVQR
jgi:hypothetical protein